MLTSSLVGQFGGEKDSGMPAQRVDEKHNEIRHLPYKNTDQKMSQWLFMEMTEDMGASSLTRLIFFHFPLFVIIIIKKDMNIEGVRTTWNASK